MAQFIAKTKPPDWSTLLAIDPIQVVESLDDEVLERLYPALVSTKIEPSDPNLTIENLLHLFRITQLCMEVNHIFLEEAEGTIVSMQETVTQKNRELKQLKSTGPNSLRDDDEIFQLKVANEELQAKNEDLTIKLRKAEENLDIETSRMDGVNMELKNERTKSRQLSETIEELNVEVKELRTFRDQFLGKKAEEAYKSQIKDKNNAINRYLAEIQQLSVQNNQLTADFETLTVELEAAVTELEANSQEIENLQKSISQYEEKTKKYFEEGDLLRKSENDLSEKIKERDQRILELETQLKESQDQCNLIKSDLLNKDHIIETLEGKLQGAKANSSQIDDLKGQLAGKDEIIQDLQKQIEEGYRDFELLSLDWQQVEEIMKNKPSKSEARQTLGIIQELKSKISGTESQNSSLIIKMQTLESELAAKEERLSGITKKLQDYENGVYGLKEAREEIDSLIQQKKIREDDIVALTKKCNSLQFSVDELTQENHDLRSLLGPEHADVDIAKSSKTRGKTELEKLQSLNARLTSEIDQLEEERLQLKSQLRLHALQKGETALKLGLTAEEMITVDNFIDKIRADKDTVGGCDQKQADVNGPNAHIEHIISQLEDVQRELRSAREEHRLTETRLRDLNEENQKLQQAIIELTTALPEGNRERTQTSDLAERIIEYLEQKAANGLTKLDSSISTASQEKYQALNETSTLRSELLRLRETILERESQMDLLQKRITELEGEITEQHDFYLEITASHTPKCSVKPDVRSVGICTHEVSADSVGSPPSPLPSGGLSGNSSTPAGSLISANVNRRNSTRSVQLDIGISRWPSLSHSQLLSNTHGSVSIKLNQPLAYDASSHPAILPSQTDIKFSNIVSDAVIGASSENLETAEYPLNNSHSESSHMNNLIESYKSLKRQFDADRHEWEAKLNKCRSENEHLLSLSNQHEWTIQQLQDTLTVLNFEPHSIQTKYQDLSRKIILSRLTEKQLSRKISVLLENEELHRRESKALQDKLEDLERKNMVSTNELRIAYEQSLQKLEKLEAELQDSVSKTTYSFIECKLLAVLAKYEHLLEKQVEDVELKAKFNTAIRELEETRIETDTLRTELELSQKLCEQMNLANESIKQVPDNEEPNNLTSLRRENCILQQKIVSLQVQVEAANKRAALSDAKGMAFLQVEKELKTALDDLQQQYLECKEENVRLRDSESALQQQLERSVTKVEIDQRIKQVSELESKIIEIQGECSKYKMLAKVAMSQVNDMLHFKSRSSDEDEQLRQALSDLQSESDQKLLVGNLHRQIINLQRSKADLKIAAEGLQTKCNQLESSLLMILQTRLTELRLKYGNGSSLLKAEKLIKRLREVQETANGFNESVTELRVENLELSNALAEAKLKIENEQDLVRSLKEGNYDLEQMKLSHDKVAELKLVNMRLNREVAFLREKQLMHEKEIEQRLQTISELEERLVKAEVDSEKQLIDFESRELNLEKVIHHYEEEREKAIKAAANFQDKPDGNLPLHEQLESACILIAQKNEVILSQNAAIQKLEAEAEVLVSNYKEAESKAISCESSAAALELQVAKYAQAESFANWIKKTKHFKNTKIWFLNFVAISKSNEQRIEIKSKV
ncbi:hypothetical protein BKA69DRAFT_147910 [Paraphysoderma sedebokerense]|nr:hypothetical protein BKA69DRAFT_147910 [Paraphysoderma sedebokerense]